MATVLKQDAETRPMSEAAAKFLAQPKKHLINGTWVDGSSAKRIPVYDPATGAQIDSVPVGGAAEIDQAVRAARTAFESGAWPAMSGAEREVLMWRLASLLERDADLLAELESIDNGKPQGFARMVDVGSSISYIRYMAGWATKIHGKTVQPSFPMPGAHQFAASIPQAVGVVGQIIPWNFPLLMAVWKIAPALATGCTCILKPAEQTSLSALYLGQLIVEAGVPAGVINIVTGLGHEAGAALTAHPGVDKIAFTGSTEVGKIIGKAAMDTMKRVSLELGGKSPVVICEDANIEQAVQGAAQAIFFNSGQVCTAGSRVFVHEKIFDKVLEGMAGAAKAIKVGPGWRPDTFVGPLVSQEQKDRVLNYIGIGKSEGASVLAGGEAGEGAGYFVQPTVLANVKPSMRIVREEIFGPVVAAQRFSDIDEAVRMANDTEYGLAASVWTTNLSHAHRISSRLNAGTVWVNAHNLVDAALPFGGFKQSGIGREHGEEAIRLYTELKTVWMAM